MPPELQSTLMRVCLLLAEVALVVVRWPLLDLTHLISLGCEQVLDDHLVDGVVINTQDPNLVAKDAGWPVAPCSKGRVLVVGA
jgi:hypothetical protein